MPHVSSGERDDGRRHGGDGVDMSGNGGRSPSGHTMRSRWWYLLPIFLDIVGGVIAYFVLRSDDPQKARNCLLLGAVLFIIHAALFAASLIFGFAILDEW